MIAANYTKLNLSLINMLIRMRHCSIISWESLVSLQNEISKKRKKGALYETEMRTVWWLESGEN